MEKDQEKQILLAHLTQAEGDLFIHDLQKKEAQAVKDSLGKVTSKDSGEVISRRQAIDNQMNELDYLLQAAKAKKDLLQKELSSYE